MQLILASASPRRKKLFKKLGLKFKVIPSHIKEDTTNLPNFSPEKKALKLAYLKAKKIKKSLLAENIKTDFLIIGADTMVVLGKKILGKPKTKAEAEKMLTSLKARKHKVITAVALLTNKKALKFYDVSFVLFKDFSFKDLKIYLDNNKYFDKAGAYGIQDLNANMLKSYKGSYTNILGLPLEKLASNLKQFNVKINKTN